MQDTSNQNKLQQQFKTTLAIHQLDTKIARECHARKNVRDKSLHWLLGTQTKVTARGGKQSRRDLHPGKHRAT